MLKFSAWLAILTGMVLTAWVTTFIWWLLHSFAAGFSPAFPAIMVAMCLAAALLIGGGVLALRKWRGGSLQLACAWGVAFVIAFAILSPQLEHLLRSERRPDLLHLGSFDAFFRIAGMTLVIAFVTCIGLFTAIIGRRGKR